MNNLNDTLQKIVNEDYDVLLKMAKTAMGEIIPYCQKIDSKNDGILMLTSILMAAVSADNQLSALESKFIGEMTGLSNEQILSLARIRTADNAEMVDRFADILDAEAKAAICLLVSTVFACDQKISADENQYLRKLLA